MSLLASAVVLWGRSCGRKWGPKGIVRDVHPDSGKFMARPWPEYDLLLPFNRNNAAWIDQWEYLLQCLYCTALLSLCPFEYTVFITRSAWVLSCSALSFSITLRLMPRAMKVFLPGDPLSWERLEIPDTSPAVVLPGIYSSIEFGPANSTTL